MLGSILGSVFGGSGGGSSPASGTAPVSITFGSVNYKSDGAGDGVKSAGPILPAQPVGDAYPAAGVPVWVWIVGGLGIVAALAAMLLPRRRRAG